MDAFRGGPLVIETNNAHTQRDVQGERPGVVAPRESVAHLPQALQDRRRLLVRLDHGNIRKRWLGVSADEHPDTGHPLRRSGVPRIGYIIDYLGRCFCRLAMAF
ncbi:MAG: hypothetical protein NTZ56_00465 [Acidobacteria bacterium]|nr:hypothetical protein [Acidobacteriota bacterium]